MHVLMLCALEVWALPGGGGAPSLYRTLRAYGEAGHRVTVIGPTIGANHVTPADDHPTPPPAISGVHFELFHLPSLQETRLRLPGPAALADQKLRFALLFPLLAARRAERILQRELVDVLYAYEVHACLAARLLRRRPEAARLPTVARFQGTVMAPAIRRPVARLRKQEEVLALRTPADLYIMTDDGTQGDDVLASVNPASLTRMRFWRNGLDLDRLLPAAPGERQERRQTLGLPGDAFVMLTASRLVAWKRVERAVEALPLILPSTPNALLVIVGDGEERPKLERLARDLGVGERVRFAGGVPQEQVLAYMQASDVLLAVADLTNVGNPLLEAMCCELPVVAVDGGDTRDLIRDGETGRLLSAGEPARIAGAAVTLAADAALWARLAQGARHYAIDHFWTWEARLQAELEEVERLAGGPIRSELAASTAR